MRCDEYLHLLSTSPVEELTEGRAGDHLATCPECNRVTQLVVDRDRNMVSALAGMSSYMQPSQTAHMALNVGRHHRLKRVYIGASLVAGSWIGALALSRLVLPANQGAMVEEALFTEAFNVRCMSTHDMADLMKAQITSRRSSIETRNASRIITVRATQDELDKVRATFNQYDNASQTACVVPQPQP
jgi:hypothetical protein